MGLDALFSPRAVAVVGASNRELTIGYRIIENLLDFCFTGAIYPVNPNATEVMGLKAYASVLDIPETVELAVIVVASPRVPKVIRECQQQGIKAAVVVSGGFAESGGEPRPRLRSSPTPTCVAVASRPMAQKRHVCRRSAAFMRGSVPRQEATRRRAWCSGRSSGVRSRTPV